MEQKTKVEVEIKGHKAKIDYIKGEPSDVWTKRDRLCVRLSFDHAVESVLAFPVYLPVKLYERDEFLEAVRREGEKRFEEISKRDKAKEKEYKAKEEKQKALDVIAEQIKSAIGLT